MSKPSGLLQPLPLLQAFAGFPWALLYTILVLNHFAPKHPATLPCGLQPCPAEPLLTLFLGPSSLPASASRLILQDGFLWIPRTVSPWPSAQSLPLASLSTRATARGKSREARSPRPQRLPRQLPLGRHFPHPWSQPPQEPAWAKSNSQRVGVPWTKEGHPRKPCAS